MIPDFNLSRPDFFHTSDDIDEQASHDLWTSFSLRKRAAVLTLVTPTQDGTGLAVLLTKRSRNLRTSPGLAAFPGGKVEGGRGRQPEDEWTCALREAFEETGFDPNTEGLVFTKLGIMPCYLAINYIAVRACVAYVETADGDSGIPITTLCPRLSKDEVELAFTVDLASMLRRHPWYVEGIRMQFVQGHDWLFHDYMINLSTVLESYDGSSSDESTATLVESTMHLVLQGLTAHIVIDLARVLFPMVEPEMEVIPCIGSNLMMREFRNNQIRESRNIQSNDNKYSRNWGQ